MKTRLLQIIYVNLFVNLDHTDAYNHLKKFYEIFDMLGAHEREKKEVVHVMIILYMILMVTK